MRRTMGVLFFGLILSIPLVCAAAALAQEVGQEPPSLPTTTQPPIIIQQAPSDTSSDSLAKTGVLPGWAEAGIAGLVVVGFITKQLVAGWQYSDRTNELKESRTNEARLVQQVLDTQRDVLPALQASTTAHVQQAQALDRLTGELKERREHGGNVH